MAVQIIKNSAIVDNCLMSSSVMSQALRSLTLNAISCASFLGSILRRNSFVHSPSSFFYSHILCCPIGFACIEIVPVYV